MITVSGVLCVPRMITVRCVPGVPGVITVPRLTGMSYMPAGPCVTSMSCMITGPCVTTLTSMTGSVTDVVVFGVMVLMRSALGAHTQMVPIRGITIARLADRSKHEEAIRPFPSD
ncbi:hypothetical protein [Nocardia cyriacigeorgica]|uniref:hypothetical protein n=1 Tax=Nocardia cyriacigeorgica TaxID=135487 RepID=UPI00245416EB|nr:hypothetical protein [Nocardia cyriacigeorgica]